MNPLKHCGNCAFAAPVQVVGPDGNVQIGQKVLQCHRMPPTPLLLPSGAGTLTVRAMFPVVDASMSCAEHREPHPPPLDS